MLRLSQSRPEYKKIKYPDFEILKETKTDWKDNTSFIEYIMIYNGIIEISRPPGFGKSTTLSMLQNFFDLTKKNNAHLFHSTVIWKKEEYRKMQGQHPVIFLSFASITGATYEIAFEQLKQIMSDLYAKYQDILLPILQEQDKCERAQGWHSPNLKNYEDILKKIASKGETRHALKNLSRLLFSYYGKKYVIILIDDVDIPFRISFQHRYHERMHNYIKSILLTIDHDNPYVTKTIMTNVIPIPLDLGFFYAIRCSSSCMIDGDIFNHSDIVPFKGEDIRCGGYCIAEQQLRNPGGSIRNEALNTFLNLFREKILEFFKEISVKGSVEEVLGCDALYPQKQELEPSHRITSLLLHAGLLTVTETRSIYCKLVIPNEQARQFYQNLQNKELDSQIIQAHSGKIRFWGVTDPEDGLCRNQVRANTYPRP